MATRGIRILPNPATTRIGGTVQFTAQGRDANGNAVPVTPAWTAAGGAITQTGLYTADGAPGSFPVVATSGSVTGTATVSVMP